MMEIYANNKMYAKKTDGVSSSGTEIGPDESPHKEELALIRARICMGMVRKAIKAGVEDKWSEVTRSEELNPWMRTKLKESYYKSIFSKCCR